MAVGPRTGRRVRAVHELRSFTLARGAVAGAAAAAVWAAQQPIDKRVFGCAYDDVELLGRLVTRGRRWPIAGAALHLANGALFGATYALARPLLPGPDWARGLVAGEIENFALWPLGRLSDRYHPARGELPRLGGNRRALAQATWRHGLFGIALGRLEGRTRSRRGRPESRPQEATA
jgi:hypothetical protein